MESVRYFLFVPWLFRMLKQAERERFAQRTRQLQDQLRRSLVKGGESLGVIGYLAGSFKVLQPNSLRNGTGNFCSHNREFFRDNTESLKL